MKAGNLLAELAMPTIRENRDRWQRHEWSQSGDEWSPGRSAEGSAVLWQRTIFPRIQQFVPTGTILEIGPGFGRWTQYLRHLCRRLIVVDLSERCIESCRERFAGDERIEYIVNDGASLEQIEDGSVDFIFSFDSLVHAEADAIGAYLTEARRKLKPGGAGFVHHSNLKDFVSPRSGRVRWFVTQRNWRAPSMSADTFQSLCATAGLACYSQELINWLGRSRQADRHRLAGPCVPLTDCLSIFGTAGAPTCVTNRTVNHTFVDEWRQAVWMADLYYRSVHHGERPTTVVNRRHTVRRKIGTARRVRQRDGWRGIGALAWERAATTGESIVSACRARLIGEANRWFLRRHFGRHRAQEPSRQLPPAAASGCPETLAS